MIKDEEETRLLHPKMRVYYHVKGQELEFKVEKCFALLRYDQMGKTSYRANAEMENFSHSHLPFCCSEEAVPENEHMGEESH